MLILLGWLDDNRANSAGAGTWTDPGKKEKG